MGFCVNDEESYDAFFSYASSDNEIHNNWVANFEQYLKSKISAQLERSDGVTDTEAGRFCVCRDETGFPKSGDLNQAILEKVNKSQFLFLFLGKGYLKSKYCLSEVDIFRNNFGSDLKKTLNHMYVIVLDKDALAELLEGQPSAMPSNLVSSLLSKLRELAQEVIRCEKFVQNGSLIPVFNEKGDAANSAFHNVCIPIVEEFAKKLIARRETINPAPVAKAVSDKEMASVEGAEETPPANAEIPVTARIWVEWEESDKAKIKMARRLVLEHFNKVCGQIFSERQVNCQASLDIGEADWANLKNQLTEKPDGIVIVYNDKKDYNAFKEQEKTISNDPEVYCKKMFPGLFYMRSEGMYKPPGWSVVRFVLQNNSLNYDPDELEEFIRNLVEILYCKYLKNRR